MINDIRDMVNNLGDNGEPDNSTRDFAESGLMKVQSEIKELLSALDRVGAALEKAEPYLPHHLFLNLREELHAAIKKGKGL